MTRNVRVLGGFQTDFSKNWAREEKDLTALFTETLQGGFEAAHVLPGEVESAHVGNFTAELFCDQGHLGGFFTAAAPEMAGTPAMRHEAACASGSMAMLSAMAEIEAGRYDLVAVLGIEMMRNVPGTQAAAYIGPPAMWAGRECVGVKYPWPHMFGKLGEEYERRYGLKREHLSAISKINFENAKRNPNSQTRKWGFEDASFTADDDVNPVIDGMIRKHDCSQMTDGGAVVFLASDEKAAEIVARAGRTLDDAPRISGWGHKTAHIGLNEKLAESHDAEYVFPHVRSAILDMYKRAGITTTDDYDGVEVHDCFTPTEYMAIDHLGLTAPGEGWKAIERGDIALGGKLPINPSGGLIGCGHPVGATGVRMMLDCWKQVTERAGDYQVTNAKRFGMLNLGGSATTAAAFMLDRD
ncbi:acetyl-CoA acetyltransferase [Hyphococcus lacteus]|uniref:Acetyl-CoA acetyltransferase n=1 Tax=Hyphococcus lacteus TaxID=3143536 RepID=A0ABV3Z8N9_9PROT